MNDDTRKSFVVCDEVAATTDDIDRLAHLAGVLVDLPQLLARGDVRHIAGVATEAHGGELTEGNVCLNVHFLMIIALRARKWYNNRYAFHVSHRASARPTDSNQALVLFEDVRGGVTEECQLAILIGSENSE